jgi:hypothetical protein
MATPQQVFLHHERVIREVIQMDVLPFVKEIYKQMFKDTVYSFQEGMHYERTEAAFNAVEAILNNTGNKFLIKLFSDPERMVSTYPSIFPTQNQDNRESIISWLNDGTNSPVYSHPRWDFIGKTKDTISKDLNIFFVSKLRARGIKARVV